MAIARPLVLYIGIPMALGVLLHATVPNFGKLIAPWVQQITRISTWMMLVIVLWMYGADMINTFGSMAVGTLILFCAIITAAPMALAFGLPREHATVLALGSCTRNIGAAIAPLMLTSGIDRRAIVMCAIAIPI